MTYIPGTQDWAAHYWGSPTTYVPNHLTTISFCGRDIHIHEKSVRAWRRFERIIKENSPKWADEIPKGTLDDWSYSQRQIVDPHTGRPTGVWSNHAFGIAVDIDATKNVRGANPQAQSNWELGHAAILKANKEGIYWGGYFHSTTDAMHEELHLSPAQIMARFTKDGKLK